jgi:hypothetical protein
VRRIDLFLPERTIKPNEKQMNRKEKRRAKKRGKTKRKEEKRKAKNETTFCPSSIMTASCMNVTFACHSNL